MVSQSWPGPAGEQTYTPTNSDHVELVLLVSTQSPL